MRINAKVKTLLGIEADWVRYESSDVRGVAWVGGIFGGLEWFPHRRWGIQLDVMPALVGVQDENPGVSGTDFDIVVNTQVNWYWGKSPQRRQGMP